MSSNSSPSVCEKQRRGFPVNNSGKCIIEESRSKSGSSFFRIMTPDGKVMEEESLEECERIARAFFRTNASANYVNIGHIEIRMLAIVSSVVIE